jgi:iron complex transport system permease protein
LRSTASRFILLALFLVVSLVAGVYVGSVRFSTGEVFDALLGIGDETTIKIVREVRLPRVLLAALAGGSLAAAGAAYQGLFRNPLADPFIMGSASGAALGATLVLIAGASAGILGWSAVSTGAFLGSLIATAIVYFTAAFSRTMNLTRLLLAGLAVGSAFNALAWILLIVSDKSFVFIVYTLLGSLSGRGWPEFLATLPWTVIGLIGLIALSRPLDALSAGDAVARGLGMRVRLVVAFVMVFAGLITGAAVAAGGVIGFIGLVAPYLARPLVGHRHLTVIPASTMIGMILLVLADTLARSIRSAEELPVGVVTALLAGPFFLFVLRWGPSR